MASKLLPSFELCFVGLRVDFDVRVESRCRASNDRIPTIVFSSSKRFVASIPFARNRQRWDTHSWLPYQTGRLLCGELRKYMDIDSYGNCHSVWRPITAPPLPSRCRFGDISDKR